MYYVYILYSEKYDKYYIGQTDNLEFRMKRHNEGKVRYTKIYIPWKLEYYEEFNSRGEAMKREKFLKKQKNKGYYKKIIDSSIGRVPMSRD